MKTIDKKMFEELTDLSVRMGKNLDIIQANGGNTSIKSDGYLYVKGSGKKLANAKLENIFAKVLIENSRKSNNLSSLDQKLNKSQIATIKPSIEVSLHKLIKSKIVLHSHPIDIIAQTISDNGRKNLENVLKDINWTWIDYFKPGDDLAKEIEIKMNKKDSNVFILQNHGLIIGAETPRDAEVLQNKILNLTKLNKREFQFKQNDKLRYLSTKLSFKNYLPKHEIIHSLAIDNWSYQLSQKNPHCPDHAVLCGIRPNIIDLSKQKLSDINPKFAYLIIKDLGVIFSDNNDTLEAMLRSQAEIFLRLPKNENVKLLTKKQCEELINWDAEKFRKKMIQ